MQIKMTLRHRFSPIRGANVKNLPAAVGGAVGKLEAPSLLVSLQVGAPLCRGAR